MTLRECIRAERCTGICVVRGWPRLRVVSSTESNMHQLREQEIREAFDASEGKVLLVAERAWHPRTGCPVVHGAE